MQSARSTYKETAKCIQVVEIFHHSFACLHILLVSLAPRLVHNTTMFHSYEEFLWKYSRPEDRGDVPGGHTLGHGGASTGVER